MTQANDNAPQLRGGRRYYLSDIPLDEALQRFLGALEEAGNLSPLPGQLCPAEQAQGRITASAVNAAASSPHYDAAAMDGIAVKAADTTGASETAPVSLAVGSQVVWVDTGDPMPPGYNAVIMIEHVHQVGRGDRAGYESGGALAARPHPGRRPWWPPKWSCRRITV